MSPRNARIDGRRPKERAMPPTMANGKACYVEIPADMLGLHQEPT
jgi:hypothetical protein